MLIKEIMTKDCQCIRPSSTLSDAAKEMKRLDVGSLPVCGDDDKLAGMLTDRDIVVRAIADDKSPDETQVQDAMTSNVSYCFDDEATDQAVENMKGQQIRRLIVLNRDKKLVGIVSLGDLATKGKDDELSGKTLEQISEPALS